MYGCIQAIVRPKVDKDGKLVDSNWFDVDRLKILSKTPVMNVPNFVKDKGPENKPLHG